MKDIRLNTIYENGIEVAWKELRNTYPNKCAYFTNMRSTDEFDSDINEAIITLHGIYDIGHKGETEVMEYMANKGIILGSAYTSGGEEGTFPCLALI